MRARKVRVGGTVGASGSALNMSEAAASRLPPSVYLATTPAAKVGSMSILPGVTIYPYLDGNHGPRHRDREEPVTPDPLLPRPVGGHPVLDFVNLGRYARDEPGADILRTPAAFTGWCATVGFADAGAEDEGPPDARLLNDAAEVRESIRLVVEAIARDEPADADALARLHRAYVDAITHADARLAGRRLELVGRGDSARGALRNLTTSAVELLHTAPVGRLKECPGCGFVFLDATRNGSRRWCSMDDCGSEQKARRYVTKRSAANRARRAD